MRLRVRLGKLLFWTVLLAFCTLAGALGFAYSYYTDSATLRALIKAHIPRYLNATQVDVGTTRVRPLIGDVTITHIIVRQVIDGANFQALVLPWLHVRVDPRAVLEGRFEPQEVVLAHPTLSLCQRRDGTWNFEGLLADPWPAPALKEMPPIVVQNGTIVLTEKLGADQPATISVLREASLRIEPAGGRRLKFEGSAKGEVLDYVKLAGTFDLDTGRVALSGDVTRIVLSDKLFQHLPGRV
ncbi:MAG TPA: hypothetical protein VFU72_00295, partial [Nitrolancea sp.]|nr:hypothetical protein [Nitrolancea sp.]